MQPDSSNPTTTFSKEEEEEGGIFYNALKDKVPHAPDGGRPAEVDLEFFSDAEDYVIIEEEEEYFDAVEVNVPEDPFLGEA
ncbi:hypothetical protein RUND412_003666 [Rhizina undulata]